MPSGIEDRLIRIEESLKKLVERSKKIDDVISNQDYLQKGLDILKKEICTFKIKNDDLQKEMVETKKIVTSLQAENLCLRNELKSIRLATEDSVHKTHANEAIVTGFIKTEVNDLKDLVLKVGKVIGQNLVSSDIVEVVKIGARSSTAETLKIKFNSSELCTSFISKGRKKKISTNEVGMTSRTQSIFFNESLSQYARKLFFEARQVKKDLNYKYVWVRNGKIFLRKTDNEKPICITSLDDIITIRK